MYMLWIVVIVFQYICTVYYFFQNFQFSCSNMFQNRLSGVLREYCDIEVKQQNIWIYKIFFIMFSLESFHYFGDIFSILMCFFNTSRFITARNFDVCCVNSHNLSRDKKLHKWKRFRQKEKRFQTIM